jgi:hypothetical protein
VCGKKAESDLCFLHKRRKGLKTSSFSSNESKKAGIIVMQEFFLTIWKERPHKSEISGDSLGQTALSIFFHHILSKGKVPQAKFDPENIVLVTLDEHSSVELDMYKYEKINYIREKLLLKYGL